jgi:hypothetical protein
MVVRGNSIDNSSSSNNCCKAAKVALLTPLLNSNDHSEETTCKIHDLTYMIKTPNMELIKRHEENKKEDKKL